jgi:hypothetical protein
MYLQYIFRKFIVVYLKVRIFQIFWSFVQKNMKNNRVVMATLEREPAFSVDHFWILHVNLMYVWKILANGEGLLHACISSIDGRNSFARNSFIDSIVKDSALFLNFVGISGELSTHVFLHWEWQLSMFHYTPLHYLIPLMIPLPPLVTLCDSLSPQASRILWMVPFEEQSLCRYKLNWNTYWHHYDVIVIQILRFL